jgi:hypothetical protein
MVAANAAGQVAAPYPSFYRYNADFIGTLLTIRSIRLSVAWRFALV